MFVAIVLMFVVCCLFQCSRGTPITAAIRAHSTHTSTASRGLTTELSTPLVILWFLFSSCCTFSVCCDCIACSVLYFVVFRFVIIIFLFSLRFCLCVAAVCHTLRVACADVIEIVTIPNNPDGVFQSGPFYNTNKVIYDLIFYWPQIMGPVRLYSCVLVLYCCFVVLFCCCLFVVCLVCLLCCCLFLIGVVLFALCGCRLLSCDFFAFVVACYFAACTATV